MEEMVVLKKETGIRAYPRHRSEIPVKNNFLGIQKITCTTFITGDLLAIKHRPRTFFLHQQTHHPRGKRQE